MKNIIFFIFITILFFLSSGKVYGNTPVAESSAHFVTYEAPEKDMRAVSLKRYLEKHNSPLANDTEHIIKVSDEHGIPWTWIPAISGVESTFCKAIPYNSYNCWGWANGTYRFTDYKDAVSVITKSLKERYVDRGADSIEKIAPIYAPPSNTWARNVTYFIGKIEDFEKTDTGKLSISL